jgi:hypothetical protein
MLGFITKLFHFALRVFSFQCCEVYHTKRKFEALYLTRLFDTSSIETGNPFFHTKLVYADRLREMHHGSNVLFIVSNTSRLDWL